MTGNKKKGKFLTLEFRFMCTSSERTGVRNCTTKVSRFSGPNDIHTKVRIWWISYALASYSISRLKKIHKEYKSVVML